MLVHQFQCVDCIGLRPSLRVNIKTNRIHHKPEVLSNRLEKVYRESVLSILYMVFYIFTAVSVELSVSRFFNWNVQRVE